MDKWLKNNTIVTKDKDRMIIEGYDKKDIFDILKLDAMSLINKSMKKFNEEDK
jgi:hypothetical protein